MTVYAMVPLENEKRGKNEISHITNYCTHNVAGDRDED